MPEILLNHRLKDLNSFHLDVRAKKYCQCSSVSELQEILASAEYRKSSPLIIGEASNILFSGDYEGLVLRPFLLGREIIRETRDHVWIRAGAGENWDEFVDWCTVWGYGGLENLSLIPGSVGSSPIQNIGAYGVEVDSSVEEVYALDVITGSKLTFRNESCRFAYRDSIFKHEWKGQCIVTSILFRLSKKPKLNLSYGIVAERYEAFRNGSSGEIFQISGTDKPDKPGPVDISKLQDVQVLRQVIINIRRSKLPDPGQLGNAGSFFKNPVVTEAEFNRISGEYPGMPSYPQGQGFRKIPAAWLIEQSGWKGKRLGDAGTYEKQPLVLVNFGNAGGKDILELASAIEKDVFSNFGIRLEKEVNVV